MAAKHPRHHDPKKRTKPGRQRRGGPGDGWRIASLSAAPVGPDIAVPSLEEVLAAMAQLPSTLDVTSLAPDVLPVLPRVRPQPPGAPEPTQLVVPPGIAVRFGVDRGPMFLSVHAGILEDWGMSEAELLALALENLRRRSARVTPGDVFTQRVAGTPVRVLQSGTSSGSALLLLPDELTRLFGNDPQLFVAPMRDLLLSLPPGVDRDFAWDLYDTFASQDPNCLPPMAFPFAGGRVGVEPLDLDEPPAFTMPPVRHH